MSTIEQRMSLRELVGGVAEDARDLVRGESPWRAPKSSRRSIALPLG